MQTRDEHFFEDDDRNRLLEAIEQQAKSLSMARGSDQHRLSDWLNAAEEVMPEVKKPTVKQMSLANNSDNKSNTAQILGFLLAGTIVLSMAGGGAFAYVQFTQQITTLEKDLKAMHAHVSDLEKGLQEADKKIAVLSGESSVAILNTDENKQTDVAATKPAIQQLESILDNRFKQLIDALDNRMQSNKIAAPMPQAAINQPSNATITNPTISTPNVAMPVAPQVVEVKIASSSTDSTTSSDNQTSWLQSLPAEDLVLQLGSSTKAADLLQQGAKIRKNTDMAHVISVKANGSTRYILVYGGFTTREAAKQSADEIKSELGVSPWIRRVTDVRVLLDKR